MKPVLLLLAAALLFFSLPARTGLCQLSSTDLLNLAHQTLLKADAERDSENFREAVLLYGNALNYYLDLGKHCQPNDADIVKFRTAYCRTQIKTISAKYNIPVPTNMPAIKPPSPVPQDATSADAVNLPESTPVDTVELLEQARKLLKAGKPDDSMKILMRVLRGQPGNTAAKILIGAAQCHARRFEEAAGMMEALLEEDVSSAHVYIILGTAYFCLGRTAEAQKALTEAISIDDSIPEAHYDMAIVMLSIKPMDTAGARLHYRKSLELGGAKNPKLDFLLK